jgi:hypothetical protein
MFRSAISFERRTNSGPLALIQLIRTTESMEAITHLLPQSEIAANSFAQDQLRDSGNVGS